MLETTNRSVQIGVGWRSKIASNGKFWVTLNKSTQVIGKADFPFGHRTQYPVISSAGALLLNLEELLGLLNSGKERDQRRCKASCSCKGTSKKKRKYKEAVPHSHRCPSIFPFHHQGIQTVLPSEAAIPMHFFRLSELYSGSSGFEKQNAYWARLCRTSVFSLQSNSKLHVAFYFNSSSYSYSDLHDLFTNMS